MITQLKRYEIQVLLRAGHTQPDTARIAEVSLRTVQRVVAEPEIETVEDDKERARRRIGRPSTAEPFRSLTEKLLKEEPEILSVEALRRARAARARCSSWWQACDLTMCECRCVSRACPASSVSTTSVR